MANWVFEESILAPRDKVELNYSGPNPFQFYKKMDSSFIQKKFEVGGTDVWERDFRWSADSDPHAFFIRVFVRKEFDNFTTAYFEILFQGEQPTDASKNGKVRISIGGNLRTEFEIKTPFQQTPFYKGLLWLYIKLFYNRVRMSYLKICQELINELVKEMRSWGEMPEVVYV
jgi:hypothetical protein